MNTPEQRKGCTISFDFQKNIRIDAHPSVYRFNLSENPVPGCPTPALTNQLKAMVKDQSNQRDHRIGTFLLEMIGQGQNTFTALDWGKRFDLTKTQYGNDIRRAVNLGLVIKKVTAESGKGSHCVYQICGSIQEGMKNDSLRPLTCMDSP